MNIHLKFAIFRILPTSAIPLLVATTSYIVQSIAVSIIYFLDPLDIRNLRLVIYLLDFY